MLLRKKVKISSMTKNRWGVEEEWITIDTTFNKDFFNGMREGYPLCCVMFFSVDWHRLQFKIPEFSDPLIPIHIMHNKQRVMCPRCILENLGEYA